MMVSPLLPLHFLQILACSCLSFRANNHSSHSQSFKVCVLSSLQNSWRCRNLLWKGKSFFGSHFAKWMWDVLSWSKLYISPHSNMREYTSPRNRYWKISLPVPKQREALQILLRLGPHLAIEMFTSGDDHHFIKELNILRRRRRMFLRRGTAKRTWDTSSSWKF